MLLVKGSVLNFNRETKVMEFNGKLLVGTKIVVGDSNILENIYIVQSKVIYTQEKKT
jgi:hypothetical protein